MQNAQLTLLIPDSDASAFNSPALQTLIKRSDIEKLSVATWEAVLYQLFGITTNLELPIAAITGLADGLPTQSDYWLRADPVQLQPDLSAVYLIGNMALNLSSQEVKSFQQELNQFFQQDQLQLFTPSVHRWYLQLNKSPQITTHALDAAIGKNILEFLPEGTEQIYWRKLLTEIQMLLHASPTNQQRIQNGLPAVSGLWFWGAGQLPVIKQTPWQRIWSDDILLKGLAQAAQISFTQSPEHAEKILQQLTNSQHHLVSLSSDLPNAEENWFKPLVNALRKKQLNQLTLYFGKDKLFHISSKTIKYFWRRK